MNVAVCIKYVAETPKVEIDPQTSALIRAEGKMIINPFDMYALEEGVQLKERYGAKVTAISMGRPEAVEALREAIALGVDEAVLLSDPLFDDSDTLATAHVLAMAIEKLDQSAVIICGRQAIDGDTGQVAPELAERLGLPFASCVSKIEEIHDNHMRLQRMVDEGHQVVEVSLPLVISVVKEINVPRLPSLRGLMQSKKADIPTWTAKELGIDANQTGLAGSPTRIGKVFFPEKAEQGELLEGTPDSQVDQLLDKLRDAKVI